MNQDFSFFDNSNHNSNDQFPGNSEIFNDINYDLLNNLKNQSSQNINPFSFNSYQSHHTLNKSKEESEIESDEEKELNQNNNCHNPNINSIINNNYFYQINNIENNLIINKNINNINNNICNNCCQCKKYNQLIPLNENNNKILQYEDYFLNASFNNENNLFNFNNENNNYLNLNLYDKNNKSNISFNNNNNNNNKIEINTNNFFNINLNPNNNNNLNNLEINNIINKDKTGIEDIHLINKNKKLKRKTEKTISKNLLNNKRKTKKRKKDNRHEGVIEYGHPQKLIYKTIKQKLNIHKKLDLECRNDSILLIYTISKLKNIIKNSELKGNMKDKINLERIKNLYRNSIISLEYKEYAQDITGYKLI